MTSVCAASTPELSALEPKRVELAAAIEQFISPEVAGNVVGNSIAILTDRDVLLFDATLLPATADALLKGLRELTPKPMRYLVNSHWHPDHAGGNDELAKMFPDLEIIASRRTREMMKDTANVYVKTLEFETCQLDQAINKELKFGKTPSGQPLTQTEPERPRSRLTLGDRFLAEFKATHSRLPTLTFDDSLTLIRGGREFRFFRLPGHTARTEKSGTAQS
jgi:cyclase